MTRTKKPWLSPPDAAHEHDGSKIEIWLPQSDTVCTKIVGHFHHRFAEQLMLEFDEVMGRGEKLVVWHDWGDATGYDTKVKMDFTSWALKRGASIQQVHIFAASTFLRLGIKVSNLATGRLMTVYDSREKFRNAAQDSLAEGKRKVAL